MNPDNAEIILMQNPQTLEIVECKLNSPWRDKKAYAAVEECAKNYEKQGYVRWGKY